MTKTLLGLTLALAAATATAQPPLLHLAFDDGKTVDREYGEEGFESRTLDSASGTPFDVVGLASFVPGVSGQAIKLDGFTSYVDGMPRLDGGDDEEDELEMPREITIEAWVALGAYPWNWAPILTAGRYKITGFYFGIDSRGRVGFHVSDATSVWHECNSPVDADSKLGLPLREWSHVVGVYRPDEGLSVYINGRREATYDEFQFDYGIAYSNLEDGFRVGRNRIDLPPSDPIRDWATYPSQYTLDGIVDELKVHSRALSAGEIAERYRSVTPENPPEMAPRRFPTVPASGRFAASYTRLKFYPEWDNLWPVGDDLDVAVQFDRLPVKLMFWRGTRHSACWVTENGKWMADQSRETGNNWFLSDGPRDTMPTGCIEHMSDTQCRSSRVQIIESNAARCVVNWRYLQMDVKFRQQDAPNGTGFGEWGNEYYYIYPDGVAVRKLLPGYGGWQETIFLNEPGTRPEDNCELDACTLVNLRGESRTYSWADGYPEFDLDDPVIQMTNLKSRFRPFMVFPEGSGFDVFNLEVRPEYSHFPWWNHWPVAQVISDGRSASAPDRAAHSSLSWGDPNGDAALYGMTDQPAESLTALALSWNRPPAVALTGQGYASAAYDSSQRAYVVQGSNSSDSVELRFDASVDHPIVNLAIVVEDWAAPAAMISLDGERIAESRDCRQAVEYDVAGAARLIVWLECRRDEPVTFRLTPRER